MSVETRGALVKVLGRPRIGGSDEGAGDLRGARQVALLALLVAHRGRPLRREVIEDQLWVGAPVGTSAVRVTVGRLRRHFTELTGVDPIASSPAGYALDLAEDAVDAGRFRASLDACRSAWVSGDVEAATHAAVVGEALWTGPAYEGISDLASIVPDQTRLDEGRRDLRDLHAACVLVAGRPADALDLVAPTLADDPYREATWALRIAALHLQGHVADSFRTYDDLTALLDRDLGIGPSRVLVALREALSAASGVGDVLALACPPRPARGTAGGRSDIASREVRPRTTLPVIGRGAELAVAEGLITDGHPRVWVVEGPAGLGKSRLADDVCERAATAGLLVATGACPRDDGVGLLALRGVLAGLLPAVPVDLAADPSVGETLVAVFPELADVLPSRAVGSVPPTIDADAAQTRVFSALERVVEASPPALIVLDDVHWIDDRLAAVVAHLAQLPGPVRWLFLARNADRRPAAVDLLADLARGGARLDALSPLDEPDAAALVRAAAPNLSVETIDAAVARSGGHPFALVELARHAAGGRDVTTVPTNVEAVIAAEVGRLDDDAARLAETIAVAGRLHPVAAVTSATGIPGRRASAALRTVLARGLAVADDRREHVWASHDLVRSALLAQMAGPEVQATHRRLADALAVAHGAAPVLRLHHLLACGDAPSDEIEAVAAAAIDDPALLAAPHQIADLGTAFLAAAGPVGTTPRFVATRLRIASARFAVGDLTGAQALLDAQRPILDTLDDPVLEAHALLTQTVFAGHGEGADVRARRGEDVLARLEADDVTLAARLACWVGHSVISTDPGRARSLADQADAALADLDLPSVRAEVVGLRLAVSLTHMAPPDETDEVITTLASITERTTDPHATAYLTLARLEQAVRTGTAHDLGRCVERAATVATPAHQVEVRWWARAAQAGWDLVRGDLAAAHKSCEAAMSFGVDHGVQIAVPMALLHRFVLDWDAHTFDELSPLLPPATPEVPATILLAHAHACLAVGDVAGAAAMADRLASPEAMAGDGPGRWPVVAALSAHAAWRLGHARLGEVVVDALADREEAGLTMVGLCYTGSTSLARGLATAAAGRTDDALETLHAAVERETWFGSPPWIARAARATAGLHERRAGAGDGREAAQLRRRAEVAQAEILPSATGGRRD